MALFSFTPDFSASNTPKVNVLKIKFGDGYEQRQRIGINATAQSWSLTFANRDSSEAASIKAFLTARGGVEAFDFIPPGESTAIRVKCDSGAWSITTIKGNFFTITAKFEQVFEP